MQGNHVCLYIYPHTFECELHTQLWGSIQTNVYIMDMRASTCIHAFTYMCMDVYKRIYTYTCTYTYAGGEIFELDNFCVEKF